jgi:hypothetical protein
MKKATTILSLVFCFVSQIFAQAPSTSAVSISGGGDIEMPFGLDHSYLSRTAENSDIDVSHLPFDEGKLTRMDCDNGTSRLTFAISPKGSSTTEFQFSLLAIDGRIDMVRYNLPEENQYLEVSAENEEVALEGVFLKKDQVNRTFVFYYGAGTNIGYSHAGKVTVKGYLSDMQLTDDPNVAQEIEYIFDQKDGLNQRIFAQAGMGIRFLKRMEFGLNFRKGFGYRASFGGPFRMTRLKRSIGMSLRFNMF